MADSPNVAHEPNKIEKMILPFIDNAALWPVAAALFGHVALLQAVAILYMAREASVGAIMSLGVLVGGTLWLIVREWRRKGRPSGMALTLTLTWAAAVLCAWGADRAGAF